jgi:hypothetical protein
MIKKRLFGLFFIFLLSLFFSIVFLSVLRIQASQGDLFSQINLTLILLFVLSIVVLLLIKKKWKSDLEFLYHVHAFVTINLLIFILLQSSLVNIDRSRSFYVLSWAQQNKVFKSEEGFVTRGVTSLERMNSLAINARIEEQIRKNLLTLKGEVVIPTGSGKLILRIADTLAFVFNLDNWSLNKK